MDSNIELTDKNIKNFWKHVKESEHNFYENIPCWEWQDAIMKECGIFGVNHKRYKAHRISWILENGKIPNELYVLHKCDNRPCVNPNHLFLGTQKDNIVDMINKGRRKNYLNNPRKLNRDDVIEIRRLYTSGEYSQPQLAKMYNVSTGHICNITTNRTWKL